MISVPKIIFPRVSDTKIEKRIFVGPQIRKLVNDEKFDDQMN